MKKETYIAPQSTVIALPASQPLMGLSVDKGVGGTNTPEGKEIDFDEEDSWTTSRNLWDE